MAKTVMLVDDSAFMRMIIKKILIKNNYTVVAEGVDGNDGYEKYKQNKPDVVFMDVVMPNLGGIDCLKKIKADFPDANVLMCSSAGQQSIVSDAIKNGAKGFIVKPFQEAKILEELSKL
ncbi:MAG: response regulator [Candidatus Aenigmarchaeota archaeon]|nr:response regulator [Candidatus Aenigmarchaeota archaeon]